MQYYKTVNAMPRKIRQMMSQTPEGRYYLPTEIVIHKPQITIPRTGNIWRSYDDPVICDHPVNVGDDGHVEFELQGYLMFDSSTEMMKELPTLLGRYVKEVIVDWLS